MLPDYLFESIINTLTSNPEITTSKMFGSQGLKIGGKVLAMLVKGKLVVKLPLQRVDELIASGKGTRFDPGHGRIMKEWVAIEPRTYEDWLKLVEEARDYLSSAS
ncbi:MAG: TfoX/Sxy family protein [Deltaproteobacteria bacterium]|nr:TfoX/Sxy family protein [Deltaproteobacteria bacterium]